MESCVRALGIFCSVIRVVICCHEESGSYVRSVGTSVGVRLGAVDGRCVGVFVGGKEGVLVVVGDSVVGESVGERVGRKVGVVVGDALGMGEAEGRYPLPLP